MKILKSKEDIKVGDLYSTYPPRREIQLLKVSGIYEKGFKLSRLDQLLLSPTSVCTSD